MHRLMKNIVLLFVLACGLPVFSAHAEDPTWTYPAQHRSHHRVMLHRSVHFAHYGSRRGYAYNPAWQAAPGDTRCCPNNMLVCPLGRHFCGH